MTNKIIPEDVYDAMNNPFEGFDKMYYKYLNTAKTNSEAFEMAVSRMQEYFPNWSRYKNYISYSIAKNKRIRNNRRGRQ